MNAFRLPSTSAPQRRNDNNKFSLDQMRQEKEKNKALSQSELEETKKEMN